MPRALNYPNLLTMTYKNEFDDPSRAGFLANIGPKAAFFIVLIALSFMVGVVWKLYSGASNKDAQNVPIVRADSEPLKITPDDPGGMEIRHKESTLFSAIKKEREEEGGQIENLLADDENEEPMPRSQLFAGLNTNEIEGENAPTPLDQPLVSEEEIAEEVVEEVVEEKTPEISTPEPIEVPEKVPEKVEVKPEPVKQAAPSPAPAPVEVRTESMPVVSKEESATGDYFIQLASTKDKASAESEWKKFTQKYSAISNLPYRIQTADLGEKGVFYRIQAGPISKESAVAKCVEIKKITPNGCLVTK